MDELQALTLGGDDYITKPYNLSLIHIYVKKLYSPKTGKTYDGTVVLADTGGKYVNYRIEVKKN